MKKIGLIGGITPESTVLYYQILNRLNANQLGKTHSAELIITSFDFGQISQLVEKGRWDLLNKKMAEAGTNLENAGASCILICANTMHLCINEVRKVVRIPVIHIADSTAKEIQKKGIQKVALLGTKYTMEKDFFRDILNKHAIETIIPDVEERDEIHRIIYDELAQGEFKKSSKEKYLKIIDSLILKGAKGIILGCTEIPLLINQNDVSLPIFDTTRIHAAAGFEFATK
jgi:aspartate racemase